jgi:acyl-[acyl-carrier-protein]-phospholipid O-acyltransferase / long-chain-fatty-acid--[acyl-carrier-protein] ligase
VQSRGDRWLIPTRKFLRMCRGNLRRPKIADSLGMELTGAGLLTRSLVLRRLLGRVLAADERQVGLLLPPSVPAVVANAALLLDRRVPINLNYTVSSEVMAECLAQAKIRHVLTSRKVMERFEHLRIDAELVYLDDLKDAATVTDKLVAAAQTWLLPAAVLERMLGLTGVRPEDLMTVIFTSGSTGQPKGVMLSYRNVGVDVEAFNEAVNLNRDDVLLGILPLFHSFGYTVTLWAALILEPKVAYHYNPLEYHQIGKLARKHGATILVAAPTFLRSYVRRIPPEDFAALNLVVTGSERLPRELADAFEAKFKVRPVEGYGTTELSPAAAVNVPTSRSSDASHEHTREGTVGRPLPGVRVKVVDLDTGEDLGPGRSGMLLVKGDIVMKGYLGRPELTAEVIRDGWYITGDVAEIDAEGFIRITGRQSRFSKIAGEMVPHVRIEEAITALAGFGGEEEETVRLAVTAVPDAKKGERLIVLHTGLPRPPEEICRELAAGGLPPLWIPSPDSFWKVAEIPVLGTGKVDLRQLKEVAVKRCAAG